MRNLALMTLLLLFIVLYSSVSRIFNSKDCNNRSVEIVSEKRNEELFERCLDLESMVQMGQSCLPCSYAFSLKQRIPAYRISFYLLKQRCLSTHLNSVEKNEYTQPDLLELHNTKEITIGYFLML